MQTRPLTFIATLALACAPAFAQTLSKGEYEAERDRIKASHKTEGKACESMSGNSKDICEQEVKARQKVALAELEYRYTAKADDANRLAKVKAETAYDVAKEKCDDLAGDAKNLCQANAKKDFEAAKPFK